MKTPDIPSFYDIRIINKYLKNLTIDTEYAAYSIDDDLKIIKGIGQIKQEDNYNYLLYFNYLKRWWTTSLKEIKKLQLMI